MHISERYKRETETAGTVPEDIWEYYNDSRRKIKSSVADRESFKRAAKERGATTRDIKAIDEDFNWAEGLERKDKLEDADLEMGSLAETIMFRVPDGYGWYGEKISVATIKTTPYDDFRNGADLIREIMLPNGDKLWWIEDITVAGPDATSSRAHEVLEDKVNESLRRAADGEDSGMVKYRESVVDPETLTTSLEFAPRVVISLPRADVIDMTKKDRKAMKERDRTAMQELRSHRVRQEYLSQLRAAFVTYRILTSAFIERTESLKPELRDRKKLETARAAIAKIDTLLRSIPGLRDADADDMENEWLREFYVNAIERSRKKEQSPTQSRALEGE